MNPLCINSTRRFHVYQQVVRCVLLAADRQGLGAGELKRERGREKTNQRDLSTPNNLYNYHHLLLFLSGKETLHPFGAIAPGSVTSKLIITIKISPSARERHWASCRQKELGDCKCRKGGERKKPRRFLYLISYKGEKNT